MFNQIFGARNDKQRNPTGNVRVQAQRRYYLDKIKADKYSRNYANDFLLSKFFNFDFDQRITENMMEDKLFQQQYSDRTE
ncbi:hypothetical protein HZH68_005530 [Vespula germanica]|uniref:Uncharacterized protein n=1 Tax=Vespula germanica TaxID=30212 RepID=A0A834KG59_VESGE|nr:hypothetical protein HZH68_005530 [Vespula germanica]